MTRSVALALFVFLWAALGSVPAHAQDSGRITGTVVQDGIGDPLPGASVTVDGARDLGDAASGDGTFDIEKVPAGEHTLVVSLVGFETARQDVTVESGEATRVRLELIERPVEISELVVERVMLTGGRAGLDDIPGSAHYLGPRELEQQSFSDINRILREVPGVYLQEEDGYGLRPNIGLRGTGSERSSKITVMEDGVLAAPAPYAAPSAYYFPTAGRMQAVEVRKGSSQIKYGPYTTGGALNLISTQIPSSFSGRLNVLGGSDAERVVHAYVGDSYENFGFLAETYQAQTNGFKELQGFANADAGFDYNTGFDKKDYLVKARVNTDPDARVYQALTVKVGQTDETSNETYLGLTESDFADAPYARYAGSQEDVMNTEHEQYQLRHVIRPARFLDVTTTAYRNNFKRNWFKLDDVRDGQADDADGDGGLEDAGIGISSILSNPAEYADELAIVRGAPGAMTENVLEVKNNNRAYYSQGVQTVAGLTFEGARLRHEVELGLRLHQDEIDRFQWVNDYRMDASGAMRLVTERTPGTESNRVIRADAVAAFGQYRLQAGRLTVVPGLRYESIQIERTEYTEDPALLAESDRGRGSAPTGQRENSVDVLIPGIGADVDVTEVLNVFAGVHKGFAPPGSSPGTDPEASVNYELGGRFQQPGFRAQAVGFFNDYSNLLGRELAATGGDPSGETFNGGAANVAGAELSASYDLGRLAPTATSLSFPLTAAYTYTYAAFANDFESDYDPWGTVAEGDRLPYLPEHQLAGSIGVRGGRFGVELAGKYRSEVRTVAGQGAIPEGQRVGSYVVLDAAADVAVTRYARLFASVRNLTDNTYAVARRPAGLRPGLPRTILLGLKASF